jgi:hypothetical protein
MVQIMRIGDFYPQEQRGTTFLWALTFISILSLGVGKLLTLQSTQLQRMREDELLWAGTQYRKAIKAYYNASPGEARQLPNTIDDLLEDSRLLTLTRHLRSAYLDPMTSNPFEEIHDARGSLIGVRSTSAMIPIKSGNFPMDYAAFSNAKTYHDWEFIFLP